MATLNIEAGKRGRRPLDADLNMIPMIDLLMVTISFLLITAVWVASSRLEASATAPGKADPCSGDGCTPEPRLHVDARGAADRFVVGWKLGSEALSRIEVPREARRPGETGFPALAEAVAAEWRRAGRHREPGDRRFDEAVIHTPNDMTYADLVRVMDAVAKTRREGRGNDGPAALVTTFATD